MKKKIVAVMMAVAMTAALAACGSSEAPAGDTTVTETTDETTTETTETTETTDETTAEDTTAADTTDATVEDGAADEVAVMTYAEYMAAEIGTPVVIESYVMGTQSWYNDAVTVYLSDAEGAYFVYKMACTEEQFATLTEGTKIRVTGAKAEYAGEIEIGADDLGNAPTFEVVEGADAYEVVAVDVTEYVGTEELINFMNYLVQFSDMTVVSVTPKEDDSDKDLYVTLAKDDVEVSFCLEYWLNGYNDEELFNAVSNLTAGDVVTVQAYLYWYNGANGHITGIAVQ